jgi:hypothetical protein
MDKGMRMRRLLPAAVAACLAAVPAAALDPSQDAAGAHAEDMTQNNKMMSFLVERGRQAMALHDISAAQSLLKLPADLDVAEAKRLLAQTYDPVWLTTSGVQNIDAFADINKAAQLYAQAAKLGDKLAIAKLNSKD